jgi:hypothetical protein
MVVVRARLVTAVPLGPRAFSPSAHVSQRRKVEPVVDHSGATEVARLAAELDELARYADAQEKKATQLQTALETRVVIERAVGMLAERFDLSVTEGFTLLRHASRDSRRQLRALATELTETRTTPAEITAARMRT